MLECFQKVVGKIFRAGRCQGKQSWAASNATDPFMLTHSRIYFAVFQV